MLVGVVDAAGRERAERLRKPGLADGDELGVRVPLVLPFAKETVRAKLPANLAARETLPLPVWTARLDLTLPAG